jgi:flavin reductase (DIM6/NTAB) family NADH-FMN oxidoreductase RutF
MNRRSIPIEKFSHRSQHLWDKQWLLLTSGDWSQGVYNAMTVGWGSIGVMWGLPFIQVVVRPVRYTFEFMERFDTFTVCAFPEKYREALNLLGTRSGRDGDKISASGLVPIASTHVAAPGYAQASLILECRKMYWADLVKENFLDKRIAIKYPRQITTA